MKSLRTSSALVLAVATVATVATVILRESSSSLPSTERRSVVPESGVENGVQTAAAAANRSEIVDDDAIQTSVSPQLKSDSAVVPGPVLGFIPTEEQARRIRRLSDKSLEDLARRMTFGGGFDVLTDERVRTAIAASLDISEAEFAESLQMMYRAKNAAFDAKVNSGDYIAYDPVTGPPRLAGIVAEAKRDLKEGVRVYLVLRNGEFPEFDDARKEYLRVCDSRMNAVLSVLESVLDPMGRDAKRKR